MPVTEQAGHDLSQVELAPPPAGGEKSISGRLSERSPSIIDGGASPYRQGHRPGVVILALRRRCRPYIHGLILVIISSVALYSVFLPTGFHFGAHFASTVAGLSLPGVSAVSPSAGQGGVVTSAVLPRTVPAGASPAEVESSLVATAASTSDGDVMLTAAGVESEMGETVAVTDRLEPFTLYEVQEGDTVSAIATRFGVSTEYILWNNVDLPDEDFLEVGQIIVAPTGNGILHEVRLGETLTDIADRYGVDLQAVVESPFNDIRSADDILESQLVFVPGGTVWLPEVVAEPEEGGAPEGDVATEPEVPAAPAPEGGDFAVVTGPASAAGLIWPVVGPISSYYGPSHPLGIDIDMFSSPNAPIAAATSGVITFAGGNPGYSYGLYVIIMNPSGIETLYAHMSQISVVQGQQVAQGDVLGYVGCTGYCTGNHLHFEVIDNGARQNPLDYLP